MLGLPSAGGNAPEWQLAQAAVTVVCVWFQLLGLKLLVEWQLMQLVEPTGMCPLGLPLTDTPLWHEAQLVDALKLPWSGLAPAQPLVTWQLSQLLTPAWMAVPGLPTADRKLPVWHVAHCALTLKFEWKRPVAQLENEPLWQLSQLADEATATEANGM